MTIPLRPILLITINPPSATAFGLRLAATLGRGVSSVAYIGAITATGGAAPYTYAVTAGSLPTGLSLSAAGAVTGTPSVQGHFSFEVTATDSASATVAARFAIFVVSPVTLSGRLALAETNNNYASGLTVSGGAPAYVWAITAGSLPAGYTINSSTGIISTTTAVSGDYLITIRVTDSGGLFAEQATILHVADALSFSYAAPYFATENVPYNNPVIIAPGLNGVPPIQYSLSSGTLPPGLTINSATGAIEGIPTAAALYTFSVDATDSLGIIVNSGALPYGVVRGRVVESGVATLVAGTVTVSSTNVSATSRFSLTPQAGGISIGTLRISATTVGTNFTILSTSATDTCPVYWEILE